jgi:ribosomal protein RSM22 (predicted rRNA methylase)
MKFIYDNNRIIEAKDKNQAILMLLLESKIRIRNGIYEACKELDGIENMMKPEDEEIERLKLVIAGKNVDSTQKIAHNELEEAFSDLQFSCADAMMSLIGNDLKEITTENAYNKSIISNKSIAANGR